MAIPVEGAQGRGKAGIFGSSISPIQYLLQQQANSAKRQAQLEDQYRQDRDKVMDYNEKYNPTTKFEPLNYRLNEKAQQVRDFTMDAIDKRVPMERLNFERQRMKGVVDAYSKELDGWKGALDDMDKTLDEGIKKGVYNKTAKSRLRDVIYNPDGSLKDDGSIREGMANIEQLLNSPDIYDPKGTIVNWVDNLKDQGRSVYSTKWNEGYTPDQIENTLTSRLKYVRNQDGSIKPGPDGNPIPIIDETTFALAKMDPNMRVILDAQGGPDDRSKMKWLQENIPGGIDAIKQNRQISSGHKKDDDSQYRYYNGIDFGLGNKVDPASIVNRFDETESVLKTYEPGKLSKFVDLSKGEDAYYTDKSGNKIVDSFVGENGARVYKTDKGGYTFEPPTSVVLEKVDPQKQKVDELTRYTIMADKDLTESEKADKLSKLSKAIIKVKFDKLDTKEGRVKAHNEMSDILDTKYSKGQSIKEGYDKVMKSRYGDNKPVDQDSFNKKWAQLKSGESLIGPDGKTYTKK